MRNERRGGRTTFLFGLLVLLVVSGGHLAAAVEAGRNTERTPTPGQVVCPPGEKIVCALQSLPTEEEVRGAIQSLYFYAYKWGTRMPRRLRPMPLDQVICTLIRDQSPRHEARRRLAIMKLVGSLRPIRQPIGGAVVLGPPQFCAALIRLNAPLDKILLQVEPFILGARDRPPPTIRRAKAKKKPKPEAPSAGPQQRTKIERATEGVLDETFGPLKTNCAVVEDCSTPSDVPVQANAIGFTIKVKRTLSAVQPVMDPQTWDDCNSSSFKKTYIAAQKTDGTPVIDDTTGDAQPASNPPAPGTVYGGSVPLPLFEYYDFTLCSTASKCPGNAPTSFKNILNIAAADGQDPFSKQSQHEIGYSLLKCTQSVVLGTVQKGTGIDIDQGFVTAIDDGASGTDLKGQKIIKFSTGTFNAGLNTWAQAVLPLLCDEVAGKSGGGVCCDLGP